MSKLDWNEQQLRKLGRPFLRRVRDNMRNDGGAQVQLGETGQGIVPNYQVTFSNGMKLVYRGSTHKQFENADEFNAARISDAFELKQIIDAYKGAP